MAIIVDKLTKFFGEKEIFSDVSFRIENNDKIGFIGQNGEGKTTLIKCLLGLEEYDSGHISVDKNIKIGYSAQMTELVDGNLWEQLISSCEDIFILKHKIEGISKLISQTVDEEKTDSLLEQYAKLEHLYEHSGGYIYEQDVRKVAFALGFSEKDFLRPAKEFSGGQKTRMFLAGALLRKPDFLFLDEPTNHLDVHMIEWLATYLQSFSGGLLLVSHDRLFLDQTVNKILQIENKKVKLFTGNYTQYIKQKKEQDESLLKAYEKQKEHIEKTEEYIRRYKAGIKSKQARGRQSQLDRLIRIEAPNRNNVFYLNLPKPQNSAEKVMILENIVIGYNNKSLLKDITLNVKKGEKIALLGDNATGKTTFLKSIMGIIKSISGRVSLGNGVKIGYFAQGHENFISSNTILEEIISSYDIGEEKARNLLGGMLFKGDEVFKRLNDLSGGEQARVALLKLLLDGANFLILDEPTNHLDIAAREVVEEALSLWSGTLLLVSHDRYFLNKISSRIWAIEDGTIKDYKGDYSYYLSMNEKEILQNNNDVAKIKESSNALKKTQKKSIRSYSINNLDNKIDAIELSIREEEAFLAVLEKRLADPEEHKDFEKSAELSNEHKVLKEKISALMFEWEALSKMKEEQ